MKRWVAVFIVICSTLFVSACGDQIYLEQADIILALGIDLNEKNQITFYAVTPTFDEELNEQEHDYQVTAHSLEEATLLFDALSQGKIAKGKIETILIGKKFLKTRQVIPCLDAILRDPKNDLNSKVVMVDGAVKDVFRLKSKRGSLAVTLYNMMENTNDIGLASPTLQQFSAISSDKRVTATLPMLKIEDQQIKITGQALLDKNGKYRSALNLKESALLICLYRYFTDQIPVTLSLSNTENDPTKRNAARKVSIRISNINRKFHTTYKQNRFHFNVRLTIYASLIERTFPYDVYNASPQLNKEMEQQFNRDLKKLTQKLQKLGVDPTGFGIYAKMKQYDAWKNIENKWTNSFSNAAIDIHTKVVIRNIGNYH
jgi:Ger(x)C family germination protein